MIIALGPFYSCKHGQKHKTNPTKIISKIEKTSWHRDSNYLRDSLFLFDLDIIEAQKGDTVGFVSVSEIYHFPGNINSPDDSVTALVIPDLKGKKAKETQYLTLKSQYRNRMLAGTGISETDSLFVYDYSKNVLLTFPVKLLNVVASLSVYEDATEAMHSSKDYQIGFEINRKLLNKLSDNYFTYVYIGSTNPFTSGQMHPIVWKKVSPKDIPIVSLDTASITELKKYKFNGAYSFELDSFHYYLQQYSNIGQDLTALRLLVINPKNELVFNTFYSQNEDSSPAPVSIADSSKNGYEQWTGRLLKNRPPVILGFEDVSFGCPILSYLSKSQKDIYYMCDNRH